MKKHFDIVILNAGTLGNILEAQQVSKESLLETFFVNFFSNKVILDACLLNSKKPQKFIYVSSGASKKMLILAGWNIALQKVLLIL